MDLRRRGARIGRRPARSAPGRRSAPGQRTGPANVVVAIAAAGVLALALSVAAALGQRPGGPRVAASTLPAVPVTAVPPLPGHEVYGFVPYWEIDDSIAAHLRATDATTIALFSVTHSATGAIATTQNGYRAIAGPVGRTIVADAHAAGLRVDVTWTSFGHPKNDRLFASEELQDEVIAALVALRAELAVDGIAVDVEEIGAGDIPAYGAFVGRLRNALRAADPGATVTATAGGGPHGAALALAATVAGADRIFLMGYDYRTAASEPGASAPLTRRDGDDRSLGWSVDLYAAAGIPAERTILGLPLYGLAWPTAGAGLGSAKTGRGDIWVPRRNLATIRDPAVAAEYDSIEDVTFLAVPDGAAYRAIYYDTPRSLRPKLGLANELGLAGAGFWALGYERGLPDYTALIADFRAGRSMTVATVAPVAP